MCCSSAFRETPLQKIMANISLNLRSIVMNSLQRLGLASLLTLAVILPAAPVYAANIIVVNSLVDEVRAGNKACTLREAIQNANANSDVTNGDCVSGTRGNDLIIFTVSGYIIIGRALPTIADDLTINGPHNGVGITVDGNGKVNAFTVTSATLTLDAINIVNTQGVQGGAINNNRGTINVSRMRFSFNRANVNGGAIFNSTGNVSVTASTFTDNWTSLNGGAIHSLNGTLTVSNSTFTRNDAPFGGGGISTVSGNALIVNNTFYGNSSQLGGAGVYAGSNTIVRNNLLANSVGKNCLGFFSASQANLSTDLSCDAGFRYATLEELKIAPLAPNGGLTPTFALQSGSIAINNGDAVTCASTLILNMDQRGSERVYTCDVGAYESAFASTNTTLSVSLNPQAAGQEVRFTANVKPNPKVSNAVPTGLVLFRVNEKVLGAAYLSGGQASWLTSSLTPGVHTLYATYEGDAEFSASDSLALTHAVSIATINLTLISTVNPTNTGQAITLVAIAEKNLAAPLNGTFTFKDGEEVISGCEKLTPQASTAICVTKSLATSLHRLSVSYSGDSAYAPSLSPTIVHMVNRIP
jgi:CSLREA domain-containing protein